MDSGFFPEGAAGGEKGKLEIVLKCDVAGSLEAVSAVLQNLGKDGVAIRAIHSGVGAISKQDVLMALTGSRLVVGFNVGVAPKLAQWIKEKGVEVRLYNVIYKLAEDLEQIAASLVAAEPEEAITGKCRVIAIFESKKGVILGCEVLEGALKVGKPFRVVAAMGPVHSGRIESMQVEKKPVREARPGQQVGVKVEGLPGGRVGDFIECFETIPLKKKSWSPRGAVIHLESS